VPDDIESECGPAADGGWRCAPYAACTHPGGCLLAGLADPPHPTCIDTSTIGEAPGTSWVCGPGCPRPAGPDPARDARIDAYRDRERRRAARALDRYIEGLVDAPKLWSEAADVAGERFVEQVGDYVLARIAGDADAIEGAARALRARDAHHNGHYGVTETVATDE
jgi:hypothetical protein